MKQLQMVNTSLGMGKRCPKQTLKALLYPTIFMCLITRAPHSDR